MGAAIAEHADARDGRVIPRRHGNAATMCGKSASCRQWALLPSSRQRKRHFALA